MVFGKTQVSGIRFFFWDSQFGRFLNNGPIKGKGDPFFYFHTLLWAFLPWSLLLFRAFIYRVGNYKSKATTNENISLGVSLVTFLLFSLSRFQLPHYMSIVFPFFAIVTAQYIYDVYNKKIIKVWIMIQSILFVLSMVLLTALAILFNMQYLRLIVASVIIVSLIIFFLFKRKDAGVIVGRSFMMGILLFGFLNLSFYPALLKYQSGSEAAAFINRTEPGKAVCTYDEDSYSFAFYINQPVTNYYSLKAIKAESINHTLILFTKEEHLATLLKAGLNIKVICRFSYFHISQLTGKFLNYKTRRQATSNMIVSKILTSAAT